MPRPIPPEIVAFAQRLQQLPPAVGWQFKRRFWGDHYRFIGTTDAGDLVEAIVPGTLADLAEVRELWERCRAVIGDANGTAERLTRAERVDRRSQPEPQKLVDAKGRIAEVIAAGRKAVGEPEPKGPKR